MRILIVSDTPRNGWAIGKLSDAIIKNNPFLNIDFVAVHPKEVDRDYPAFLEQLAKKPDLIHFQYWRTTEQLFERNPDLKNYKTICTHHNQKNTLSVDWNALNIDHHITHTQKNKKILNDAGYFNVDVIQHGIDLNYFKYFREYKGDTGYVGYVGRVCPWKNLKEIAWATRQNELKVLAMGKIDKPSYWAEIPDEDKMIIDFNYTNVSDEERIFAYYDMMCFVQNSSDNHEEGTLPLLEAMACGIPVITTPSGEGADIITDNENGLVIPFDNRDALRVAIKTLKEDDKLRERLRENAWKTIKTFTEQKMAREYEIMYKRILKGSKEMISVITPAFNAVDNLKKIYESLVNQTEAITEWIICDDNSTDETEKVIMELIKTAPFAVKYVNTRKDGYNLAMARNMGIIEAIGTHIMFLDSRILPDKNAVKEFMRKKELDAWQFGDKGSDKQAFVENFSFVRRSDIIKAGMFCERIDKYGGMSQEIRERWLSQGRTVKYNRGATAEALTKSSMTEQRRQDIIESKLKLYKMGL